MGLGDSVGEKTIGDLNQYVHSWVDDATRRVQDLLATLEGHRIRIKGDFVIEVEDRPKQEVEK